MDLIKLNESQTSLDELGIDDCVNEIKDQFYDCINNIPYIKAFISASRQSAKDLPRDSEGKIIVDITQPHKLEDMDYFRPSAIHYQKHGCYTSLRPNPNPNSEFGKWIREERKRCLEGYIRESDGEWITGDYYFFLNYCPIQLAKKDKKGKTIRVVDFPHVWDGHYYKTHYLNQCRNKGKHAMELARRGAGKAHPYSQKVLTPFGWKSWGDLQIGDYVYGDDGQPTRIINIPYNEESDIYTVTLRDGRKIQCTDGHLFKVKNHKLKREEVKSLKEIMVDYQCHRKIDAKNPRGIEYNYRIPKILDGVYFNSTRVEYDPYTLGLIIGDGCFMVPSAKNYVLFTCDKHDWETYDAIIPYPLDKVSNDQFTYAIRHSNEYLRKCGLWGLKSEFKFIPKEYIYNSKDVRFEILQGLMDADGTVDKSSGIPYLSTTSERLKDDVVLLCRSLGYNVSVSTHKSVFKGKEYLPHYRIRIITNDAIFRLGRKLKLLTDFKSGYSRSTRDYTAIVNIEYSHREMAKCITVDNESHCYIIGDFVVTHNSYVAAAMLAKRFILGESNEVNKKVQCVATASEKKYIQGANQLLDMFQYYIDFCANNTEWPSRRITSSLQNLQWTMGYIDLDTNTRRGTQNSVIGITSKDDESKLRGSRGVLYLLEEAGSFPRLLNLYSVLRPSVEDGNEVFGLIYGYGCVCAGTKVLDEYGNIKNIEEVEVGNKLLGFNGENSSVEDITWKQPEAYKECVQISTEKGNYLQCSIDHPILALNKDKFGHSYKTCSFYRSNELKEGDTLLIPRFIGSFGNYHEDDAYLLGALFGDGNYSESTCVSLSITTEEEYEFYNSKYDIGISKLSKGDNTYAQIYFRGLHPLLKKYQMDNQSFDKKKLPNNINEWDKESLCNFLGGYFNADGNIQIVKTKHRSIKLTCKYEETLIQIKYLLHKLGIVSHIYKEKKHDRLLHSNVNNKVYEIKGAICYVLYISNSEDIVSFRDNIHFIINSKQERLNNYIPSITRGRYSKLKFKLRDNGKGKYFIDKYFYNLQGVTIKSIVNIGEQKIYNLTANTTHTYLTNGFISSNTAGDTESDFAAMQELMYNPDGYNILGVQNVYDKEGQGRSKFTYFSPGYLNRANCYDKDGNSDVTKALLEILNDRYKVKYNSTDINAITKRIAEIPITPQEAILRTRGNIFPVTQLNERLNEIDNNPTFYNDTYVGELVQNKDGKIEFKPTADIPIRNFPTKDNKVSGAIEIFELPQEIHGKIPNDRYLISLDNYENDTANTMSLGSIFVLDLWTDRIVAEYTGRPMFSDDLNEIARKFCLFYNAKLLYENNKKSTFAYFSKMNSLYLLEDTPEYLKQKQLIKTVGYGNTSKGVTATVPIKNHGFTLIRDWLLKPVTTIAKEGDNETEITVPNLNFIKNRALLKELILFNPDINVDRVMSLVQLMIFRESKMVLYKGDVQRDRDIVPKDYMGNDPFFDMNYKKIR